MAVRRRESQQAEFGCDFCADEQNRFFGHVTQIASDDATGLVLLRCPRCEAYYENTPAGADNTTRLSPDQAHQRYAIQ